MKPIQKLRTLFLALSLLLLSACGTEEAPAEKGPYPLPAQFEYFTWLTGDSCKENWARKADLGDANFTGFEIGSEIINVDTKNHEDVSAIEAMVTYHIFLETIIIENYVVDIRTQTVKPVGEDVQVLDPDPILARANELAKTAPDFRVGALFIYFPDKFGNEEWNEPAIQCDSTNTQVFKITW